MVFYLERKITWFKNSSFGTDDFSYANIFNRFYIPEHYFSMINILI